MDKAPDLELARQIAANSGDIQSMMDSLIDEIEALRTAAPAPVDIAQTYPALDMLFEASAQFRMYQGQHEGKSQDTKKSSDERDQHRAKANINKAIADRIDALLLTNGAPHGFVFYGPDGEWHWSMTKPDDPQVEDIRPATSLERGILGLLGGSTDGTRQFNDWKEQQKANPDFGNLVYHTLAMRTAAGPEVFHLPGGELGAEMEDEFFGDAQAFLVAAARMDDWKSRLFYGKSKYTRTNFDFDKFAAASQFPDFVFTGQPKSLRNIDNPQLIHAILGIATEGAELVENLLEVAHTGQVDHERIASMNNMVRETGDVDWFQELLASAIGVPIEKSRSTNIARLAVRFPAKFSEFAAVARADEAPESSLMHPRNSTLAHEMRQIEDLG